MRIIILGSGSIVPTPRRFGSGILLETEENRMLIDVGPGVVEKLRRLNIDPNTIDTLLITHYHIDHVSDLPVIVKLRPFNPLGGKAENPKKLHIYGPRGLKQFVEETLLENRFFRYLKMLGCHELIELREVGGGEVLTSPNIRIQAAPVEHYDGVAYRVDVEGISVVYSGDTLPDERLIKLAENCHILIHECSFPRSLMMGKHTSLEDLVEIAGRVRPKLLIPVHLYPVMDNYVDMLRSLVEEIGVRIIVPDDLEIIDV